MSGCHEPSDEPKLLTDLRAMADDILSLQGQVEGLHQHIEKLHDMINMEDRITASDVLLRITKLESVTSTLDLMIKAKEWGVQMEEGNRYGECLVGLELKLQDKIAENLKLCVKDYCKAEDEIIKLEFRIKELERFQDITNEQYKVVTNGKKPHKCPVCEGNCMRPNPLQGIENAKMPVNLDCIVCEGKGIVWG